MEEYKGTGNFRQSQNGLYFDFDIDLRFNALDYLRILPYVLFLLPLIVVLEFFSKFSKKGTASTEKHVDKIHSLQPVQPGTKVG
jgi:hypothetical protein